MHMPWGSLSFRLSAIHFRYNSTTTAVPFHKNPATTAAFTSLDEMKNSLLPEFRVLRYRTSRDNCLHLDIIFKFLL